MKVTTEQILKIRPGKTVAFQCESARAMHTVCSLVTRIKRIGMPSGVINYETKKDYNTNILRVHAMKHSEDYTLRNM